MFATRRLVLAVVALALVGKVGIAGAQSDYGPSAAQKWHALLHYQSNEGWKSDVLTHDFFLTENGATDPRGEWEAHKKAFMDPEQRQALACRFPARFRLMAQELGWESTAPPCSEFERFRKRIDAKALSVVFVSHYLSNPASAFGHALLFLGDPTQPQLPAYSLGFEADTGQLSALGYIPKGLVGGLTARFLAEPLHHRARRYERGDQRSLWIFPLHFGDDDREQLIRHLWELEQVRFPYGFFQGNCAQMLLRLVHAVNPSLRVLPFSRVAVLPSDVVRHLVKKLGRAGPALYRPSLEEQYAQARARLSKTQIQQLDQSLRSRTLPSDASADFLDALLLWGEYKLPSRTFRREGERQEHPDVAWKRMVISARMEHPQARSLQSAPPGASLLDAHPLGKASISAGWSQERGTIAAVNLRWLLHDSIDRPSGYPEFSTLEVANLRVHANRDQFVFDEFTVLRIGRTGTTSPLRSSITWNADFGARRLPVRQFTRVHAGLGFTTGYSLSWSRVNFFANLGLRGGWLVSGDTEIDNLALGKAGFLLYLPFDLRLRVTSEATYSLHTRDEIARLDSAVLRKGLGKSWDFEVAYERGPNRHMATGGFVAFY